MVKSENYILFGNLGSHRHQTFLIIQTNELMKLNEYQRSRSLFDLGQRSLRFHWLVVLGLPGLSDSISAYIGPSPREREKEEK